MLVTMTNTKEPESTAGTLDTVMLAVAGGCVLAGIVAYNYFDEASILVRALAVVAGLAAGVGLGYRTHQGQELWKFILGSRVEIRKVVWPTMPETWQTTAAVAAFVVVLAVVFWLLDVALLWLTRGLMGQGAS